MLMLVPNNLDPSLSFGLTEEERQVKAAFKNISLRIHNVLFYDCNLHSALKFMECSEADFKNVLNRRIKKEKQKNTEAIVLRVRVQNKKILGMVQSLGFNVLFSYENAFFLGLALCKNGILNELKQMRLKIDYTHE